ncbi:MAG: hypothetical protein KJZ93_30635 [Caldilineaceae bacterium]|nr:hypothetical protein [Caldilineaceae bacterium]
MQLSSLRDFQLVIPPLPEAKVIAAYLIRETRRLDTTITRTEREIALMREFRTRLVADVVTGQLDVRAAAANLPDEPQEPETLAAEEGMESEEAEEDFDTEEES